MKDRLREILRDNGIEFRSLDPVSEDAGRMKRIFRVEADRDYAAYFYLRREAGERGRTVRQRIEAEKFIFRKIGEKTELRTPKVFEFGQDYLLCEWLEGEVMSEKGLSQAEKNGKAREIGEALSQIHGIKFRKFGEMGEEGLEEKYDSWQVFVEKLIDFVRDETEKEVVLEAVGILDQNIEMMDYGPDSVLLHGDFHDGNILDRESLGILDCEAGFVGTREYEINRCITHWTEEWNCTEEFLEGYGRENLEENWKKRRKFYNLLQAAMGIVDGVRLGSEHLVEINEKGLRKEMEKF